MIVTATTRSKVDIDPEEVLIELIENRIGSNFGVKEEDGKYFKSATVYTGCGAITSYFEISKLDYDYYMAATFLLETLRAKNKQ